MASATAQTLQRQPNQPHLPTGLGMWLWVLVCLGWLLGVAWQWQSTLLASMAVLQGVTACAGVAFLLVCVWEARGAWGRWRLAGALLLGLAALGLGWGSTGWRAASVLEQQWPPSLEGADVWAVVRLQGLPQPLQQPAAQPVVQPAVQRPSRGAVNRWRLEAEVVRWEGVTAAPGTLLPEHITVYADWSRPQVPEAGQAWRVKLRLHAPDGLSNPGVSSASRSSFGRGVRAVGQLRPGVESLQPAGADDALGWQDRIDRWRQRVRDAIVQRVPSARAAGVLTGLAVGDQAAIAPADWDILRRTGVAHMVSISGAHVAMLGSLCAALARRGWSRSSRLCHWLPAPTAAWWVAVLGAALYALASGGGIPAQRTVWTIALMGALRLVGLAWPWPLVWLVCASVVTLWDPFALMQPGFWLSFVAVAVLMSAGTPSAHGDAVNERAAAGAGAQPAALARLWSTLRDEASMMWRTQRLVSLTLMPLSLVCFQQVSVVGLVANLWAIPVFGALITPLALVGTVVPQAWDVAAAVTRLAFHALEWLSALPIAVWAAPSPPLWVGIAAVLASFALAIPGRWRWRSLALPFLLPLLFLPEPWRVLPRPAPGQFAAVAMDVGQGTAVLVRTAQHTLLFDTGASLPAGGDMGARVVLPVLQALGVRRLDVLLISHQDNDHAGGAATVLRGVPVALMRSSLPDEHPLLQEPSTGRRPVAHQPCVDGQTWTWDGVTFEVLHPTQADLQARHAMSTNALSCVLRVQAASQGQSLLLTGDIETPQEQAMLQRHPPERLRSTVLMVPHHGSNTSSTPDFLAAVQAEQAVIQAGRRNRYGHPAPRVVARHEALGARVTGTPACGAWLWQSDGSWGPGQCWRTLQRRLWDPAAATEAP
jgi:competence protein ComEC